MPASVTRGSLVAHRHSFAPLSVSLWNDLDDPVFDDVGDWRVLRAKLMLSCWPDLSFRFVSYYFLFFFLPWVSCVRLESSD